MGLCYDKGLERATLLPFHHVRCSYKVCMVKGKPSPDRTSVDNLTVVFSASRLEIYVPSSWYFATTKKRQGLTGGPYVLWK